MKRLKNFFKRIKKCFKSVFSLPQNKTASGIGGELPDTDDEGSDA